MTRIYISLPISGRPMEEVAKRCADAKAKYTKDGDVVITPLDAVKDQSLPYNVCMGKSIEALMGCDHVVFLGGWSASDGCNLEFQACTIYKIEYHVDAKL